MQVTWKYACPMFVRWTQGVSVTNSSVTGEAYDLWSLGITIMEVCNHGKTFLAGIEPTDFRAIKDRLCALTQEEVTSFINHHFKQNKNIRDVLRALLKV